MAKHGRLVNVPKWSKRVQKGLKWTTYLFLPFGTRLGPSGPFCISAKPYFVHGGPQSKKLVHRQVSYVWPDCGTPKQLLCFQGKWDLCKCGNCDFLMPPIKYSISGNGFSLSGFYLSVIGAVGRSRFRGFCEIFPILLIKLWNCTKAKSWVQQCPAPAAGHSQYPVQLLTCNLVPQNYIFQSVLSHLSPIICLVMSLTH